ncbi:Uncharacterised protein [Enterobacter cloacae]|nr:Uncharacterised protein [Enterobacter cloacae]
MREFCGLDRLHEGSVFLFSGCTSGNMLYNSHFARKLRAIPGFIAKLIIVENQFSPVSNPDRRDTLSFFNVVCGSHQRQQQASCCQEVT